MEPKNVLAQQIVGIHLVDSFLQRAITFAVFVSQVEVSCGRLGGIASDDNAFEHLMRIFFDQHAIVERAWFALVTIDAEVDWALDVFG